MIWPFKKRQHFYVMSLEARNQIFNDLQNIVGDFKYWPHFIKDVLQKHKLEQFSRFQLAVFFFINGVPVDMLLEWCSMQGQLQCVQAFKHIRYLYEKMERESNTLLYYSYNVQQNDWEYCDLSPYDRSRF